MTPPSNKTELPGVGKTGTTGWILPDKTFVPLATAYHEQYLTENAPELNKKFGTKFVEKRGDFSPNADEGERLAALNKGFVRVRFEANGGILHVEVNADAWRKLKPAVVDHLLDNEGRIDNLNVSLLNNKGQVVDSIRERLFELEGAEKADKISEAVDSLRASGPRFLPRVNIGLAVGEKQNAITHGEVLRALEEVGVRILKSSVVKSDTEATVVADLDRPLTPTEAAGISKTLNQEAIAQLVDGEGELYGPSADKWRPFNPDYFLNHGGRSLTKAGETFLPRVKRSD